MFRIRKIFESSDTVIFTVEGTITDDQIEVWSQEIGLIAQRENNHLIFNFCSLAFINAEGLRVLTSTLSNKIRIMNSSVYVRNVLNTTGCSKNLLD